MNAIPQKWNETCGNLVPQFWPSGAFICWQGAFPKDRDTKLGSKWSDASCRLWLKAAPNVSCCSDRGKATCSKPRLVLRLQNSDEIEVTSLAETINWTTLNVRNPKVKCGFNPSEMCWICWKIDNWNQCVATPIERHSENCLQSQQLWLKLLPRVSVSRLSGNFTFLISKRLEVVIEKWNKP